MRPSQTVALRSACGDQEIMRDIFESVSASANACRHEISSSSSTFLFCVVSDQWAFCYSIDSILLFWWTVFDDCCSRWGYGGFLFAPHPIIYWWMRRGFVTVDIGYLLLPNIQVISPHILFPVAYPNDVLFDSSHTSPLLWYHILSFYLHRQQPVITVSSPLVVPLFVFHDRAIVHQCACRKWRSKVFGDVVLYVVLRKGYGRWLNVEYFSTVQTLVPATCGIRKLQLRHLHLIDQRHT